MNDNDSSTCPSLILSQNSSIFSEESIKIQMIEKGNRRVEKPLAIVQMSQELNKRVQQKHLVRNELKKISVTANQNQDQCLNKMQDKTRQIKKDGIKIRWFLDEASKKVKLSQQNSFMDWEDLRKKCKAMFPNIQLDQERVKSEKDSGSANRQSEGQGLGSRQEYSFGRDDKGE